jgi:DNA polymerase-3 subunit alpha
LLKDNLGYLIYQEDVIAFLQQICGMTGSEADNLRRAIARKQTDRLERALPQVLDGYCSKSDQPREVAEEEAKEFIQVIQDASSYMFGYNHSIAYCMLGYLCAYLRYYYPYEFVASYFNNIKTQEDIYNCKQLTSTLGITIKEPRFRHAKFEYFIDRAEHSVYKGLRGVKFLNSTISDELYAIKDEFYGNFMQLLSKMTLTSLKSNQRQILINLDFFEEFGNSQLLNAILEAFIFLKEGTAKQVRKNTTCNPVWLEIIKRYSTETATLYKITDIEGAMNEIERYIRAQNIPEYSFKQKFQWQMEYLGYIAECSHSDDLEERKKLVVLDYKIMRAKKAFPGRPKGAPWGYVVKTKSLGSGKESEFTIYADVYEKQPILKYSIIKVKHFFQKGDYWYIGGYDILE